MNFIQLLTTGLPNRRLAPSGSLLARGPWALVAVLLVMGAVGRSARAQAVVDPVQEANVKAVFLYTFGRYVEWPAEAWNHNPSAFTIGVLGESSVSSPLNRVAKKRKIKGRPIRVVTFATLDQVRACHILFISRQQEASVTRAVAEKLRGQHVLLVGETPGYVQQGGMIGFYLEDVSVRFEIRVDACRDEQLQMNAKLLSIGRLIP